MRYAYKVFAPYRHVRKVTVFGSARTAPTDPAAVAAREFGRRMVEAGWMVITGAGDGIMGAAQEGAGGEQSFGLNIRLPFEQEANPWIAADPKLVTFKYFFTRKLFLVKEASALTLFPGGFGTMDEAFEVLTLMQTGKATIIPMVMVEDGERPYWSRWEEWVRGVLLAQGLISEGDAAFYRIVGSVEAAVEEVTRFYRVYHSARIVGQNLVFRLQACARPRRRPGTAAPLRGHPARPGGGGGRPDPPRAPRVSGADASRPAFQSRVVCAAARVDRLRELG